MKETVLDRPIRREGAAFGELLRQWRRRRGASQLELSLSSGVSQRHVSFLESGRARPSREMVVQLAAALDVPLRQQNALLLAAGYAPVYRESDLAAPELGQVRHAIDHMLRHHEPYPAVVVDRLWNLLNANETAMRFVAAVTPPTAAPPSGGGVNLLRNLLDPKGLRPAVLNWEEVAQALVRTTYAELVADGGDDRAIAFLDELMALPDVPRAWRTLRLDERPAPTLDVAFRVGAKTVRVFTAIATLGTPQDVTLQEIRIETFWPADAASEAFFRDLAKKAA